VSNLPADKFKVMIYEAQIIDRAAASMNNIDDTIPHQINNPIHDQIITPNADQLPEPNPDQRHDLIPDTPLDQRFDPFQPRQRRLRPYTHPLRFHDRPSIPDSNAERAESQSALLHLFLRSPLFRKITTQLRDLAGGEFEIERREVRWNEPSCGWRQEFWEVCWVMLGKEGLKILGEVWKGREENVRSRFLRGEKEKEKEFFRVRGFEGTETMDGSTGIGGGSWTMNEGDNLGKGFEWDRLRKWRKLLSAKERPRSWIMRGGIGEPECFDVPFILGDLRIGVYEPSRFS